MSGLGPDEDAAGAATSTVELTGLPIASPIGFMAALGLLRTCAQDHGRPVRLSWSASHARLHGIEAVALEALVAEHMRGRARAPEFQLPITLPGGGSTPVEHLRTLPAADYRAAARAWRDDARALGFLAGYGTDAVISDKGFVARTRFDFSSGQQKLASEIRRLATELDPEARRPRIALAERIRRALQGGPYEHQHSFGWDPGTRMTHAHQPQAPTRSEPPGQPMLIWLAIESLPLHPVLPVSPQRAQTTGFAAGVGYVWPQWHEPLTLDEVRLLRLRPVHTLERLPGVTALWASGITSVGKFGFFLPAARTGSDRLHPRRSAQTDVPEESAT